MGECTTCGETNVLTRECNYCGTETCTKHILPEKHDCHSTATFPSGTKRFQSDLAARRNPDTDSDEDTYACDECGAAHDYYADARHCCQSSPSPTENVRTHGGSGRDYENADFPSSPDVKPDGTLTSPDVEAVEEDRQQVDQRPRWGLRLDQVREHKWLYGTLLAVLVLQYWLGVDVFGILQQYLPGM